MSQTVVEKPRAAVILDCALCGGENATGKCSECSEDLCRDCSLECEGFSCTSGNRYCPDCAPRCTCDDVVCEDCAMTCAESEATICTGCGVVCPDCDQWFSTDCVTYCEDCGDAVCLTECYETHAEENGCQFP